jgi:hypothetical protein
LMDIIESNLMIWVERHGNENHHGRNILMGFCLEARKRDPLNRSIKTLVGSTAATR